MKSQTELGTETVRHITVFVHGNSRNAFKVVRKVLVYRYRKLDNQKRYMGTQLFIHVAVILTIDDATSQY